jgi:hypothetical protein
MFPGHPWQGEPFGAVEYYWYLKRGYELDILFEVNLAPFIAFCKRHNYRSNQLTMKIAARLSAEHLPQYMIALNGKPYPARYPAGYVRPVREGADMLEHIGLREKDGRFEERNIRESWQPLVKWFANNAPRLSVWLAYHFFAYRETKNNYTLMVSRNPLKGLGTKVIFFGAHYRTMVLAIPYGEISTCLFTAPHAFANINFYEPFLKKFKTWMEDPGQIPRDLLDKEYREAPSYGEGGDT